MALRGQVVDLVRLDGLDDPDQVGCIRQIAVVQNKAQGGLTGVLIEVVYAIGVEAGGPALDAVDFIAFFQQEFCKIRPRPGR